MPYTPGPQDDWADWDQPTTQTRKSTRAPESASPAKSSRQGPLGVFGPEGQVKAPVVAPMATPGRGRTAPARRRPTRGRSARLVAALMIVAIVACVVFGSVASRALAFGSAISSQNPLSTQTGYTSGIARVNVVVLGYGGVGHDGAYLTDSMMVMSMVPGDHATTLVSVPRDLWVQLPPNSGQYAKINTAYTDGLYNGFTDPRTGLPVKPGPVAGGEEAAAKVSEVTGLSVPYFVTINFQGFRDLVDALGGVTINVPTAFTARYPINDDPAINAGWKIIHFNTGPQHMNGEQAIEYARARYVISPVSEGTDFARSARQQLLIRAIASRMRSPSSWSGLTKATDALQKALYSNLSLADLATFALKLDLNHAAHIGLSNQNVLQDGTSSDGQYILQPRNDDWAAVQQYVSAHLAS